MDEKRTKILESKNKICYWISNFGSGFVLRWNVNLLGFNLRAFKVPPFRLIPDKGK